jgi:hypothetical protein
MPNVMASSVSSSPAAASDWFLPTRAASASDLTDSVQTVRRNIGRT